MHIQSPLKTTLFAAGVAAVLFGSLAAAPADARTFVSVGVGLPLFYAPPPVVYAPPPVVYAPPPVVYAPAPAAYAPAPATQTCREYQSTIQVNGQPQQSYGTACLQPDGTWRIVQ